MPNPGRKLRFSDAVYAVGTTPKALRNWLQRGQVTLVEENPDGWRAFTFADIALLALVRKLVDFGINVEMANRMAHEALKNFPDFITKAPEQLPLAFHNQSWVAWPEDVGRWQLRLLPDWQGPVQEQVAADAYIVVNIENVLRRAFERARESLAEGDD